MGNMGIHANCSRFCDGFIHFRLTCLVHLLLHLSHFVIILLFARSIGAVPISSWNNYVCYLSCIVTDAVLILWWLLCFTLSVTSNEDGNRCSPKRRMALCVVTMQQTVTYSLNDTTYVKPCHKFTQFTTDNLFDVIWCGNPRSCKHALT